MCLTRNARNSKRMFFFMMRLIKTSTLYYMRHVMGNTEPRRANIILLFAVCENEAVDQLRGNHSTEQRLF